MWSLSTEECTENVYFGISNLRLHVQYTSICMQKRERKFMTADRVASIGCSESLMNVPSPVSALQLIYLH